MILHSGRRQGFVEWEDQIQPEIELNDASERSNGRSLALNVDLRYEPASNSTGRIINGKTWLRLYLATLTFLVFFYSMTLLTSYFYPLHWAPHRILTLAWQIV
jgi:hypothetical protein